jgi:hypothetical protein
MIELPRPAPFCFGTARPIAPRCIPRRSAPPQRVVAAAQRPPAEYNDSLTDILFIALCRRAYGALAGWQSPRSWTDGRETFSGMVEVSRALMKGRTAAQQRAAVIQGFPQVPAWFRQVFPYSRWGAELNARITPAFFSWLVGPMQTIEVEVRGRDGKGTLQNSGVHIERCRYLEESGGCVAMCANLCQQPVQSFFTEQLGMPLSMQPSFEDYSCQVRSFQRDGEAAEGPHLHARMVHGAECCMMHGSACSAPGCQSRVGHSAPALTAGDNNAFARRWCSDGPRCRRATTLCGSSRVRRRAPQRRAGSGVTN